MAHEVSESPTSSLERWELVSETDDSGQTLRIDVDGATMATVQASPCPTGQYPAPHRHLLTAIPVQAYIGATARVSLYDTAADRVVAETQHHFEDLQLDAEQGLVGNAPQLKAGILHGWVTQGTQPVVLSCQVDGQEIARTVASRPVPELAGQRVGYRLILPPLPTGRDLRLDILAQLAQGACHIGQISLPASNRVSTFVAELDTPEPGLIRGRIQLPDLITEPVCLSLTVNGEDRLFATTDLARDGRFSFETGGLTQIDPLQDKIEIYENLFGQPLQNLPGNLAQYGLRARVAAPDHDGPPVLVLTSCIPLQSLREVWVSLEAETDLLCLPLEPALSPFEVQANLPAEPGAELRIQLTEQGPALTLRKELQYQLSSPRAGVGTWIPTRKRRVSNALCALAGMQIELPGSSSVPDFAGLWDVSAHGYLRGWALDLKEPHRPFDVTIFVDSEHAATLRSDQMMPLLGSFIPGIWPIGFEFDLRALALPSGTHSIRVVLEESDRSLPPHGASSFKWPLSAGASRSLADLLPKLQPTQMTLADQAKLLVRLSEDAARQAEAVFAGHLPAQPTCEGERLSTALQRWADELLSDPAWRARLSDPSQPLPHHQKLPPLLGADVSAFLNSLPLSEEQRTRVSTCTNWRELLVQVLDPALFLHLLNHEKVTDLQLILWMQNLSAGHGDTSGALSVTFTADSDHVTTMPEIFQAAKQLVICDTSGAVLLEATVTKRRSADHILTQFFCGTEQVEDFAPYIAVQTDRGWSLHQLTLQALPLPLPPRVTHALRAERLCATGNFIELICSGNILPDNLVLILDGQSHKLNVQATSEEDIEAGRARYYGTVASLPAGRFALAEADCGPDEYDLRSGHSRLSNLPPTLEINPQGALRLDSVDYASGGLVGTLSSTLAGCSKVAIALSGLEAERVEGISEVAPPDIPIPQRLQQSTLPAQSPADPKSFVLPLPARILDGQPWQLSLSIWPMTATDAEAEPVWSDRFQATDAFLNAQLRILNSDPDGLANLLLRIAQAGRIGFIDQVFSDLAAYNAQMMEASACFEILATALLHAPTPAPPHLWSLYDYLWTFSATAEGRQQDFFTRARQTLRTARKDGSLRRFPTAPIGEALVDLLQVSIPNSADDACNHITEALEVRRFALATTLLQKAQGKFPNNPRIKVLQSTLALQLGDARSAEAHARKALEIKAKFKDAQTALARALGRQGRTVEALAIQTGGAGLSSWLGKVPNYEQIKQAAPLDLAGAFETVAASRGGAIQVLSDQLNAISGAPATLRDTPYSLFFLPGNAADFGHAPLFRNLRAEGQCTQVATLESGNVPEIECTGDYAFLFATPVTVTPELLEMIFAQKRLQEPVIHLVQCPLDKIGAPAQITTAGAVIRADMLRAFGAMNLDSYLERAQQVLRVKTVLI